MEHILDSVFFEISAIIVVSTIFALLAKLLKQPIILAFLLAGVTLGPLGVNILQSQELIQVLAEFGLAFLLYLIGIELDLRKFASLSRVAVIAGFGQVIVTGLVGYIVCITLGFSISEAWFIAIALTFSSTIIVVKLLSEKRELQTLYGRITIAILVIQDFLAVFALLILESFGTNLDSIPVLPLIGMLLKAGLLAAVAFVLTRYIFKGIFRFIGQSQELLFLWSIAWCLFFAGLALAINFSIAIGVFIAGIALASLEYNHEIASRIRSLRDFFIVIFFTVIGSQLVVDMDLRLLIIGAALAMYVLVGNPIIAYVIVRGLGYTKRTALFTGLAVGQISEFSFIVANVGLKQGQLDQQIVSMIAVIGVITMVVSTYLITYNEAVYKFINPLLRIIPLLNYADDMDESPPPPVKDHIVLFGYHITTNPIIEQLKKLGKDIVVVDYNPDNMDHIKALGVYYVYGDMRSIEILEEAQVNEAGLIISIVPYAEPTMALLQYLKHIESEADVVVSARNLFDTDNFYKAGATFVLHPESISLDYLRHVIEKESLVKTSELHQQRVLKLLKELGRHI